MRRFASFFCLCTLTGCLAAQASNPPDAGFRWLGAVVAAAGGAEKWSSPHGITARGSLRWAGREVGSPLTIRVHGSNFFRLSAQAQDGERVWLISPDSAESRDATGNKKAIPFHNQSSLGLALSPIYSAAQFSQGEVGKKDALAITPLAKDARAFEIAKKSLEAQASAPNPEEFVRDVRATGTIRTSGGTDEFVYEVSGKRAIRIERTGAKGKTVRVSKNGQAVIIKPDGTQRWVDPTNTLAERPELIPIFSLLSEYDSDDTEVKLLQSEDGGSEEISVVAIPSGQAKSTTDKRATTRRFKIDQTTRLVTKISYELFPENSVPGTSKVELLFSDYRSVGALMLPFKIVTNVDGDFSSEIVFAEIAINPGLDSLKFDLPDRTN